MTSPAPKFIKVFLVDSNKLSLVTLSLWMEQLNDFEVVGTALPQSKIESRILDSQPDLVIVSVSSCGIEALSTIRRIRQIDREIAIVVLHDDETDVEPLKAEVQACFSSQSPLKELLATMQSVETRRLGDCHPVFMTKAG
jgi:DNA-binding NarL/FixJ family response regulator